MKFNIKVPIWGGYKGRTVGFAEHKLEAENEVKISYKNAAGKKEYPLTYTITRSKALEYPTQRLSCGIILRIIPINDLTVKEKKK